MDMKFVTIHVENIETSIKFYEEVIGMKLDKKFSPTDEMTLAFMKSENNSIIELIHNKNMNYSDKTNRNFISLGFKVPNLSETISFLKSKNISFNDKPIVMPNGIQFIFIKDPDNVTLQFIQ